jgi:glycerol-3-phosphate O-acyltransferase
VNVELGRFVTRPLHWLSEKVFAIWARPAVLPENPTELITDPDAAVCYVLESGGLSDRLALERACRKHGMPSPTAPLDYGPVHEPKSYITLRKSEGLLVRRPSAGGSARLARLIRASGGSHTRELLLIPVAIYWGRSPDKEGSVFKLLFAEDWGFVGRTRKFFATVLQGRNTLLRFSEPLPVQSIVSEGTDPEYAFRKVSRVLRVHFRQRRKATVGPDLSHRRTLVDDVMNNPEVRAAIAAEGGGSREDTERARRKAQGYALEIAADISYPTVRVVERFLRWLWHRIYDGIELNHIQRVHDVASDREIIYVPCHRSHFDYLLLSYVVYEEGLQIPHVAAGINLNIPVVGPILRRGGAFFLRRSFKGNRLYAAVFDAYLHKILTKGHSIEYFIEGGRSRTGRLLTPKGGMLAMTVNSYVRDPLRPIEFVPVYFGYERLIEGDSFINELGGAKKQSESLFGLVRSVRGLRQNFGKVYVNVAPTIELAPILDAMRPGWRDEPRLPGERPEWLGSVVDTLGREIMTRINAAAAVTPISLLAYVLLSTPKQRIGLAELRRQLKLSMRLLDRFRYSESVTMPEMSADEIIGHGEHLDVISRSPHPMGDVIDMTEHTAVLMTYFRNNIMHLMAIPAAVACSFIHARRLPRNELRRLIRLIYPFVRKELWLKWELEDIDPVTDEAIDALVALELLARDDADDSFVRPPTGSEKAYQLLMLGQSMIPVLQRFYLAIAILVRNGSGVLSRSRLETLCEQSAERLSIIYGLHSPDFFNRALFHDFIAELQEQGILRRNKDGKLEYAESLVDIGADARLVLGEEIRHSILSLSFVEPNQPKADTDQCE